MKIVIEHGRPYPEHCLRDPESKMGELRAQMRGMKLGACFTLPGEDRAVYRAGIQLGFTMSCRKVNGKGHVYMRIS